MTDVEINLYSGRKFRPFAPRPEDIELSDIAHALSLKTRWGGHTREFYSVAQHSVWVSRYTVAPEGRLRTERLWGLLHDAGEAYLPDVPSPIKRYCPELIRAEELILDAVAVRFGLPREIPAMVHHADKVILTTEARDLMGLDVEHDSQFANWQPLGGVKIKPLSATEAEALFHFQFETLTRGTR